MPAWLSQILPECSCSWLPPVDPEEFRKFVIATCQAQGLRISSEAVNCLVQQCDGRFDTVATFLGSFAQSTGVGKKEVEKYRDVRHTVWELFRSNLSETQQIVYDQVRALRSFRISPRVGFVTTLLRIQGRTATQNETRKILESIWPVAEERAIVYEGQFSPPQRDEKSARQVAEAIVMMRALRFRDRYAFQEEIKTFASLLAELPCANEYTSLFQKFSRWYPRDRYFAYLLARIYASRGNYFRAILTLYKIFRDFDPLVVYSGKWIEVQCHLLLAQIYQATNHRKTHDWNFHCMVEKEFEIAVGLTDLQFADIGPNDFETVYASPTANPEQLEKLHERHHKELGYEIPQSLSVDSKRLRAMVHHQYASYLLRQVHREFDALKHEEVVTQILSES